MRHNLLDPPLRPLGGRWDLIVCRNVLIYLSPRATARVAEHFAAALAEEGRTMFGATDVSVRNASALVGLDTAAESAIFQRRAAPAPPGPEPLPRLDPPPSPPVARPPLASPPTDLMTRASAALDEERYREAWQLFVEAADQEALAADAYLGAGMALHLAKDSPRAIAPLRAALFLSPALWPAHYFLALSLENCGRAAEARAEYGAALQAAKRAPGTGGSPLLTKLEGWRAEVLALCARRASR